MLPLLRPKNEKDLCPALFGKPKKFRLTRNGSAVAVTGRLLAVFRHEAPHDGLMPPAAGRVDLLAVILTQAGRYFVYYIVIYPETEDIAGRQEYAHVCTSLEAVQNFLGAMLYPNRPEFDAAVIAQARDTLERLENKGKKKPGAAARAAEGKPRPGGGDTPPAAPGTRHAARPQGLFTREPPAAGRG